MPSVSLPPADTTTLLLGGALALSLLWWMSTSRRYKGLPPGPGPALPLLGHLHLMGKDPRAKFQEWRRQYGDVFSLYMGGRLVVVLNGFQVIKEALVKHADVFSHRPRLYAVDIINSHRGLVTSDGPMWKEQRKTSLEILREMGMGKNVLSEKIQEEVTYYIRAIEDHKGKPVDLHWLTNNSVSNNICSIVFGQRFEYDDPVFLDYLTRVDDNIKHISSNSALNIFPFLDYLPGDLFHIKRVLANVKVVRTKFFLPQIARHKETYIEGQAEDFIHAYLRQAKVMRDSGRETTLDDDNLLPCVAQLFVAGTETTSTTIKWTLLYFLHYPQVQERCFKEVSDVVGSGRPPNMADRPKMAYLEATIMEVLRKADIVPLSIPHATSSDVSFRDYFIPKDTMIIPNLESVLQDSEIWGDPENFRPERFFDEDGNLKRVEEFIPFSIGWRVCLGESLARMELFLYMANLVQRFQFLPEDPANLPPLEGKLGATYSPNPYNIRAALRE